MGKDIGRIYKYGQSQLSTLSLKAPVSSSSDPQTSSAIELKTTFVPSVTDKNKNNYVLYFQNIIQNYAPITNNDNMQSCKASRKQICAFPTISTPNHHSQHISTTSASILNLHTPMISPPIAK